MTIKKILLTEESNINSIYLYREGMFYKAYERSAYAFINNVKKYTPIKKYIKIVQSEVTSIGFPCAVFDKLTQRFEILRSEAGLIVIKSVNINSENFLNWKYNITLTSTEQKSICSVEPQNTDTTIKDKISDLIREFPLEAKSMLECMTFISELKREVNG